MEGGRRAFKLVSMEAGKEKYRHFKGVWDLIVIGHLGFASPAAKFASVSELASFAGISRGTAARAVDALLRWNMVHDVRATRRPLLLCVNPNIDQWLIAKTIGDDAWLKMVAQWRTFCCSTQLDLKLPDFGPADPTMQQLLALVNLESAENKTRSTVEHKDRSTVEQKAENRSTVEQADRSTVEQSAQRINNMEKVHGPNSMDHARATAKTFPVGTLGRKTGQEIFNEVIKQTGPLRPGFQGMVWRRIEEDAKLVWNLAMELRERHDVRNKAGWMNRAYMRQKALGRYAEGAS